MDAGNGTQGTKPPGVPQPCWFGPLLSYEHNVKSETAEETSFVATKNVKETEATWRKH